MMLLKPLGYATGQFGKNHLGDRDEYLPTAHGFDEFFGNLYHLNAEEEPERPYWPGDNQNFLDNYNPRGVIKSAADGEVEDTGPLTSKRMETIDDETSAAAIDFMRRQVDAGTPFFTWMNFTHMHAFTYAPPDKEGISGMPGNIYADAMVIHDSQVGEILDALDDMGIADDTIVIYPTDNGPNFFSWPDAAVSPYRSEKDTNWEGAFRVPAMIRWPGRIEAGQVSNEIFSGLDWFPTLLAAAGEDAIKDELLAGRAIGDTTFKVHLDGYNQLSYLTGQTDEGAREEFFYFDDDANLVAMRWGDWKAVFCEQRTGGGLQVWQDPFTCLRVPSILNLRMDPYERANLYSDQKRLAVQEHVPDRGCDDAASVFLETFIEWLPSQLPASFSVDQVAERVNAHIEQLLAPTDAPAAPAQ
ncbi:sulfatase-like hydrolase/transferase [Amaricoccus sp.]|uniref:sulfatase-like hydrolase/transferase n=1 Tax=Amaricoccus sp. TaxID=1872485 RepID=UPI001B75A675|nr:sulfatase-like hydrolase/transferase [Amaricoccus sp.]MBP7002181.1 sulfatase-like hydrolase/transferase [Amaricoccus sp.]